MSTRGIIARKTEEGWEGRYHHFDSYPTGLGAALYGLYNGHCQKDAEAMLKYLIDDHTGWSSISGADFSMKAGFRRYEKDTDLDAPRGPECYCHGERSEEGWMFRSGDEGFGGAEFCYIIDGNMMTVLERRYGDGSSAVQFFGVDASDVAKGVHWTSLEVVNLDGFEPRWEKVG